MKVFIFLLFFFFGTTAVAKGSDSGAVAVNGRQYETTFRIIPIPTVVGIWQLHGMFTPKTVELFTLTVIPVTHGSCNPYLSGFMFVEGQLYLPSSKDGLTFVVEITLQKQKSIDVAFYATSNPECRIEVVNYLEGTATIQVLPSEAPGGIIIPE